MTSTDDGRTLWLARQVLPHEPDLRRWLAGKRLRGIDLDDIVQETYAILAGLDCVEAIRNPKAYMFQTAYSVILGQVRRAQIVSISTIEDIGQLAGEDESPSPETEVSDRQELQRLTEAIAALPPRCREVFVLRKIHGLQQREVAQKLGVSEGTVEKHMHNGLKVLGALFGRGGIAPRQASIPKGAVSLAWKKDA
jgi:RNA polymerase sigma-70 factor (ECF subfamily)